MPKLVNSNYKPEQNTPVHELIEKPKIVPKDFKSVIVDTKEERLDTLVQYAEGSRQKVTYFRQRLSKNDSVTHFSLDASGTVQQYERIDGLEILLQGSLGTSQSTTELRTTEITGEAHVLPPVIPNKGDIMLMDIGRNTLGWFNINEVRRLTHRRNTLYEIQFSMAYEIRDQINDPRIINLNQKTIEVLKYSIDYLKAGQNPLLTPKKADAFSFLRGEYDRISRYWFRKFYHRFYETCLVPNQRTLIYDGFFMRAIQQWFSSQRYPEMVHFRIYTDDEFPILQTTSIWDAITERDPYLLKESFSKSCAITLEEFTNSPNFASIRYSAFKAVVAPYGITYSNKIYIKNDEVIGNAFQMTPSVNPRKFKVVNDQLLINQILPNRSYVFSQEFYRDADDGQSHLEIQLRKYLEDDILDVEIIEELVRDCMNWGELEHFYYLPVLLVLMNYCIRRM